MLKKKLILMTLSTICIQNSFAMESENDEYSRKLVIYRAAENIGNADVAADHLEELLRMKNQKPTQNTNNNDDIDFFNEYTKLALEFRRQGKEEQAVHCDDRAERFRTKGWGEWGADNISWGWNNTRDAAKSMYDHKDIIIGGITAAKFIYETVTTVSTNLPGNATPAPSIQPEIKKGRGCHGKHSKR